jgi:phenol hydroxylase P1 protein
MSIDIKTQGSEPRRHTFAHVARRIGGDKPATRYQEATYDMQAATNFHYRPAWDEHYGLHDSRRTRIEMADWYALLDPRQYYYATYTMARGKMFEQFERSLAFVDKLQAFSVMAPSWLETFSFYLLPLRHYEWGANMNNCKITDEGFGTAITQATMFATMDRLALAQAISRIGMAIDGGSGESLGAAKRVWLDDDRYQPMRRGVENMLVIEDWFELFVAQNLAFDGIVYPLIFTEFEAKGRFENATAVSLLGETFVEWFAETTRWVDAVIKRAASESPGNAETLSRWFAVWRDRAVEACAPLAGEVLGGDAKATLDGVRERLDRRAAGLGLTLPQGAAV